MNCWICGAKREADELVSVEELGGVSVGNVDVPFHEFICLDEEDVICEVDEQRVINKAKEVSTIDCEWQHEIAREEGMLHGIEAYNEVMGY